MKRLMAIVLLLMTYISIYSQNYVSKESVFYQQYRHQSTIKCKVGYTAGEFYIQIGFFKKGKSKMYLNDVFAIKTHTKNILLKVTNNILRKKNEENLLVFHLDTSDIEKISKGVEYITFVRNNMGYEFNEKILNLEKNAKSLLENMKIGNYNKDSETITYPSWRD